MFFFLIQSNCRIDCVFGGCPIFQTFTRIVLFHLVFQKLNFKIFGKTLNIMNIELKIRFIILDYFPLLFHPTVFAPFSFVSFSQEG